MALLKRQLGLRCQEAPKNWANKSNEARQMKAPQ
jgi:hypothetical protein